MTSCARHSGEKERLPFREAVSHHTRKLGVWAVQGLREDVQNSSFLPSLPAMEDKKEPPCHQAFLEMLKDLSSRRSLWGFFWYNCLRLPPIIGGNTYFWQIQNVHEVKVAVGTLGIILSIFPQRTPSLPRAYYPGNRPLQHRVLMELQKLSICGKFQIITPGKSSQHLMRRSHG